MKKLWSESDTKIKAELESHKFCLQEMLFNTNQLILKIEAKYQLTEYQQVINSGRN